MSAGGGHAELSRVVTALDTADQWGEEFPPAASTPFVLGLAEVTCHRVVAASLADNEITVGTGAHIEHYAPSPVGTVLTARAELLKRSGSRLEFAVDVRDADGLVAHIDHSRAIVDRDVILTRLARVQQHSPSDEARD
jgi:predicted thioesterase